MRPSLLLLAPLGLAAPIALAPAQDGAPRLDLQGDPLPEGTVGRLGSRRLLHDSPLLFAAFDGGGTRLLSVTTSGTLHLWDRRDGHALQQTLLDLASAAGVAGVAYSRASGLCLLAGRDATLEIRKLEDIEQSGIWFGAGSIVATSSDGRLVALANPTSPLVRIVELETRTRRGQFEASHPVRALAFAPDGERVLALAVNREKELGRGGTADQADSELAIHSLASNETRRVAIRGDVLVGAVIAPSGERALVGSQSGALVWFDLSDGGQRLVAPGDGRTVRSLALSPDGERVAVGRDGGVVELRRAADGKIEDTLQLGAVPVGSLEFSSEGSELLAVAGAQLEVWGVEEPAPLLSFPRHGASLSSLDASADGELLASGGYDGAVHLWSAADGAHRGLVGSHTGWVYAVRFAPDGARIASAGQDGSARVWDLATGSQVLHLVGHERALTDLDYSPDGETLLTASADHSVRLWKASDGELLRTIDGLEGLSLHARFSPDGRTIVASGKDIRVFEVTSGREVRRIEGYRGLALSLSLAPDGSAIALGLADGTVRVWRDELAFVLRGHGGRVTALAFSPCGRWIGSASSSGGSVRLWDAATGGRLARLEGYPAGDRLAAGGLDGTALLWELSPALGTGGEKQTPGR